MNKDIAKAFRDAVKYLSVNGGYSEGTSQFMCFAIARGSGGSWLSGGKTPGARAAICIIGDRLGGYETLGRWLPCTHKIKANKKQLQAHRHAWLQLLIKEFEAK